MKKIKDIILSDKTPMNENSLWLKDGNLKYFEGIWKDINTSKMLANTSNIILDSDKNDNIEYLKNFIKQGETWAKNNGTYISEETDTYFTFPVLLIVIGLILIPSVAYSVNNKTIIFPTSQYQSVFDIDSYSANQILINKSFIFTGNIIIDLNKQYDYYESTLDVQLEQKQEGLLEFQLFNRKQISEEVLTKIQNKLETGPFSCIVNGAIAFCRQEEQTHRIIITVSAKYGDPNINSSSGNEEDLYKNYDQIFNFLIDYNTGKILNINQQVSGPIAGTQSNAIGMVKQMSNTSALPSDATLATVIDSYNALLTKMQDAYMMAKE